MRTATAETGQWLRELRLRRGLSPEQVPGAMIRQQIDQRVIPSGRTIRRVETTGRMPQARHAHALATFYGVDLAALWPVARGGRR